MARSSRRRTPSGTSGLPEDLKKLQAELLEGFDLDDSSASEADPGSAATSLCRGVEAAQGLEALTEQAILAAAGEERVEDVTQLILHERSLDRLAGPTALDFSRLVGLEVLSLSHNRLTDIMPLASLESLVEVNLNFNQIADLSPLYECVQLEKLFAAHNRVMSIDGLDTSCPQIRELSLFANCLGDNRTVLWTLQGLPELRVLDLGENCCCAGPSHRYTFIQQLPKLDTLDGHKVGSFDRQLAVDFFKGASKEMVREGSRESEAETREVSPVARPCTAPPACSSRPPVLPGGGSGASAARGWAVGLAGTRLRSSRSNLIDEVLTQSREHSPEEDCGGLPKFDIQHMDLSDPDRTLRKLTVYMEALARHLETLQMERDNLKFQVRLLQRDGRESGLEGMREQLALLEEENKNEKSVESEHQHLLASVEEVERQLVAAEATKATHTSGAPNTVAIAEDDDEVSELRWENQLLRKRLRSILKYCKQLHEEEVRTSLRTGYRACNDSGAPGTAAVTEPGDGDIARLVAENESKLRQLRGEVRDTATAIARREQTARTGPVDPRGIAGIDVLTLKETGQDVEWHGTC